MENETVESFPHVEESSGVKDEAMVVADVSNCIKDEPKDDDEKTDTKIEMNGDKGQHDENKEPESDVKDLKEEAESVNKANKNGEVTNEITEMNTQTMEGPPVKSEIPAVKMENGTDVKLVCTDHSGILDTNFIKTKLSVLFLEHAINHLLAPLSEEKKELLS